MTEEENKPVGGVAFFSSLLFLTLLAAQNFRALVSEFTLSAFTHLLFFVAATIIGALGAYYLLGSTLCVFIHEFKHALLSGLAGNKVKGLVVKGRSGHFEYSYTSETAAYNAFISLGPYITPLFAFPAIAALAIANPASHLLAVSLAGLAYGADLYLNTRDLSPVQTDITGIRGGYTIGRFYILIFNVAFLTFVLAWVFAGRAGLMHLLEHLWDLVQTVVRSVHPMRELRAP